MSKLKASVVIPTLNSAQTLERRLSLIRANNSQYNYEIIVVDAGSNDDRRNSSNLKAIRHGLSVALAVIRIRFRSLFSRM